MQEDYPSFYPPKSPRHFQKLKRQVLKERGKRCERCGAAGLLHLHHRHYRTFGEETAEDVVLLCKACHFDLHDRHKSHQLWRADVPFVDPEWEMRLSEVHKKPKPPSPPRPPGYLPHWWQRGIRSFARWLLRIV